jgi:hypothetical protein
MNESMTGINDRLPGHCRSLKASARRNTRASSDAITIARRRWLADGGRSDNRKVFSCTEPASYIGRSFRFELPAFAEVGSKLRTARSAVLTGPLTCDAVARALPHLTPRDPLALVLHYAAGAKCADCKLYQGSSAASFGPRQLYPGRRQAPMAGALGNQKAA